MTARRRFYTDVTVTADNGIALDGKPIKTPMKLSLRLPGKALAEAVAAEWQGQGAEINPASMPLTRLANTAIDRVAQERPKIEAEALAYANSDLVCYRAGQPADLAARQAAAWDPVVDWARTALDAPFEVTAGLMHRPQPEAALTAFAAAVAALDDFELAAFHTAMTLTGSALIAMMLARSAILPDEAWRIAHVDEDYQTGLWGEDDEAKARHAARREEFMAACRFLALSRSLSE
jgi:chaperone required for assembly of F1-ATPase